MKRLTADQRRARLMAKVALLPAALFMQGALFFTLQQPSVHGLYNVAAVMQFMPLLYVGAYITLRGLAATWLCWIHYTALMIQFVWSWHLSGQLPDEQAGIQALIQQALLTTAVSHPLYILALPYIVRLRRSLDQARQDSYRSKARFLAMVSHEIRTPLQSMLGSIDLLAMRLAAPADQRVVARLRGAADQLQTHLRDVTEYTRLEDPSLHLANEPIDLPALLSELIDEWRASAQGKGLQLRLVLHDAERPLLALSHGDPMRVRQVLGNLLSNAIKYTPHGEVVLKAHTSTTEPGMVCLVVEDTGVGMPEAHLSDIFQPYVRLEHARSTNTEGTGLGLAVVQRLVDRMDGHLGVQSTPGAGSRFEVCLPMLHNV
ncbi:sensor histidine kinase [Aquabacterium sp.]|uniref:sensor histidine kinase n=1 Tax=Aquabacterium sp. TaxID=1872578 RepID=UPI0035B1B7CD